MNKCYARVISGGKVAYHPVINFFEAQLLTTLEIAYLDIQMAGNELVCEHHELAGLN